MSDYLKKKILFDDKKEYKSKKCGNLKREKGVLVRCWTTTPIKFKLFPLQVNNVWILWTFPLNDIFDVFLTSNQCTLKEPRLFTSSSIRRTRAFNPNVFNNPALILPYSRAEAEWSDRLAWLMKTIKLQSSFTSMSS